jgi:hypothetical protein
MRPSPNNATCTCNGLHKTEHLRMDEIMGQTPLKDLDHIQLVLTQMPSRALYKL